MTQSNSSDYITALTHWGAYDLEIEKDKVVKVHNLKEDEDPSPIGQSLAGTLDDACRIAAPMIRQGFLDHGFRSDGIGRGVEPFVAVSWDEAEQIVADEIKRVCENFGNQAIFGGSYGWASAGRFHHAQSQLHRFLNCAGGYTRSVDTYSFAAGEVIVPHVLGEFWPYIYSQTSWPSIISDTQIMLAFGGLPLKNTQISNGGTRRHVQRSYMQAAKDKGIDFINIGPLKDDCAEFLNAKWHSVRPNTDVAIMLGLAHTLVTHDLHDRAFLQKYCVGFEHFHDYLMGVTDGQPKDADWASGISDMEAAAIIDIAKQIAVKRTMISLSWSLTRQDHGEQPYWMGITLAAMLGQMGLPGGGIGFGYAAENTMGNHTYHHKLGSLPRSKNKVKEFIPVARIADMLLHPGESFDYNGKPYVYPDIKLVYWAGGNPFHQQQDTGKLLKAWQQPETIIVNEIWWNATARHADIVLPCTSPLERNDLGGHSDDPDFFAMHAAVTPYALARNDFDIFRGIASRLNFESEFTDNKDEMQWIQHLYELTVRNIQDVEPPSFEEFWQGAGKLSFSVPEQPRIIMEQFRDDPENNRLSTPSGKIEIFSKTIEDFGYDDCPPHAAWLEPVEWLGSKKCERFPLHMVSNQPGSRLHSQLDNGITSRQTKIRDREPVRIHPDDASARNIKAGDVVRLFNDRGQCLAGAILDKDIRPGLVQMATGAWWNPDKPGQIDSLCKHGQVNVLTMDKGTSKLAQGPIALSCLIDMEKYEDDVPAVTIFEAPEIINKSDVLDAEARTE
ncbi:MAG: biotin/methionine sulfoxide reductase [Planctomycetota bacterium]|jgi:biotin/methionine sulfoxide reductase